VDDIGSYNAERRRSAFGEITSMRLEDMAVAILAGHEIRDPHDPVSDEVPKAAAYSDHH